MNSFFAPHSFSPIFSIAYAAMNYLHPGAAVPIFFSIAYAAMNHCGRG